MENNQLLIIDRFEGDYAVIEYAGSTFNLPRVLLPQHAKEGDVLQGQLTVDDDTTAKRRERIQTLMNELFE